MREIDRFTVGGLVVGVVSASLVTQLMEKMRFGVRPKGAVNFTGIAFLLSAVAFVASWLPARRALRTDPTSALRSE